MDRIIIDCQHCGRPLVVLASMKSRTCAACGTRNQIHAFQREKRVPVADVGEAVDKKARATEVEPGKCRVIHRRMAKETKDGDGCDVSLKKASSERGT